VLGNAGIADIQKVGKLADGPLASGSIDRHGAFRFEQRAQVTAIAQDLVSGVAGCVLERAEVVRGRVAELAPDAGRADAGAGASGLEGETIVTVSPVPGGGDCSPLLLAFGGAFPTLPCQLRYALDGERLDEPLW